MSESEAMRADMDAMLADLAGTPVCLVEQGCGRPCLAAATVVMESGCVHEHVFTERMCGSCAALTEAGQAFCMTCWELGHECKLIGRRQP